MGPSSTRTTRPWWDDRRGFSSPESGLRGGQGKVTVGRGPSGSDRLSGDPFPGRRETPPGRDGVYRAAPTRLLSQRPHTTRVQKFPTLTKKISFPFPPQSLAYPAGGVSSDPFQGTTVQRSFSKVPAVRRRRGLGVDLFPVSHVQWGGPVARTGVTGDPRRMRRARLVV